MHGLQIGKAAVARQCGQKAQAQLVKERHDVPQIAGDIEFANQADVEHASRCGFRLASADHMLEQGLARDAVAQILAAIKTRAIDRNHWQIEFFAGGFAQGVQIVANQRGHAGRIHKDGLGVIALNGLLDTQKQPLFAAPHDDVLLR